MVVLCCKCRFGQCMMKMSVPWRVQHCKIVTSWFLTQHIPLHMSSFDVTSYPPGYLLWFHLRFLPLKQLSSLDANSATDTFCSTFTSCLDTPSTPWLSDVLREHRSKLRAAESVCRKSQNPGCCRGGYV